MTLELCGMAGLPFCAGTVHSHTPKSSFFMGFAARSHLSVGAQTHEVSGGAGREDERGRQDGLKSPTRAAVWALGAHSR